jgi:hypothetical protein
MTKKVKQEFIPNCEYAIIPYVVFPFDVLVSFHKTFDELKVKLKEVLPIDVYSEIEQMNTEGDARTMIFSSGQTVIRFVKITPDTIAHEVFHAVFFLMDRLNCKLSFDDDEI